MRRGPIMKPSEVTRRPPSKADCKRREACWGTGGGGGGALRLWVQPGAAAPAGISTRTYRHRLGSLGPRAAGRRPATAPPPTAATGRVRAQERGGSNSRDGRGLAALAIALPGGKSPRFHGPPSAETGEGPGDGEGLGDGALSGRHGRRPSLRPYGAELAVDSRCQGADGQSHGGQGEIPEADMARFLQPLTSGQREQRRLHRGRRGASQGMQFHDIE